MRYLIMSALLLAAPVQSSELYCTGALTSTATIKITIADGRVTITPIKVPERKK